MEKNAAAAVCWDFDGTLVHSHCLWSGSIWNALRQTAPDTKVTLEEVEPYTAFGFPWDTPENGSPSWAGEGWWAQMNAHFQSVYRALGVDAKTARLAAAQIRGLVKEPGNYHLYGDARAALARARALGYRNLLLSNNYPDLGDVLAALGLAPYFDAVVLSGQIGYDKPRREIFDCAKSLLPGVQHFYMVGDSVSADIAGGRSAGMTTVLVHRPFSPSADHCFSSLAEFCAIL